MTTEVVTNSCEQLISAHHAIMEKLAVPFDNPCVELNDLGVPFDSSAITALAFATHQLAEVLRARTMIDASSVSMSVSWPQQTDR